MKHWAILNSFESSYIDPRDKRPGLSFALSFLSGCFIVLASQLCVPQVLPVIQPAVRLILAWAGNMLSDVVQRKPQPSASKTAKGSPLWDKLGHPRVFTIPHPSHLIQGIQRISHTTGNGSSSTYRIPFHHRSPPDWLGIWRKVGQFQHKKTTLKAFELVRH